MTKLNGSALKRETAACNRGRPLIVELHDGYLVLREKGTKTHKVAVDYQTILHIGYKLLAKEAAEQKKARMKK